MSVKKHRALQPCTALLKDGQRCGKYAKAGEVFCAVHLPGYVPKGAAVARPKPVSHDERLRRFAESSDPRVAMQAMAALDRRRTNEDGSPAFDGRAFLDALTPEEHERVRELLADMRQIKEAVYERVPKLRPAEWGSVVDVPAVVPAPAPVEEVAAAPSPTIEEAPEDESNDLVFED